MNDLKPYPAYQEIDLPWLDKLPSHWKIQRGKTIFDCVDIRSATGEEELLTVSSERGIVPRSTANVTMFKAESYVGYKLCWPGDLVINSLWAWARGLGVSQLHGIISSAYGVYRLKPNYQNFAKFIHELVRSSVFQWELQVRSKGIWKSRLQLTDTAFLEAPFPIPPPSEQTAIARYLDWADGRIRRLIRSRQKQIKLLEERKRAIIQQAVTGQMDVRTKQPYPAYKDSGVEWLGQVPEHWEVLLNQRIFKEEIRPHGGKSETQLSLSQVDGLIPTKDMKERSLQTSTYENWKVTIPGDLVLNRFKAHLGVFFASNLRGIVSFHYGVFAPQRKLNTKYFELLCHTNVYKTIYAGRSNGMTVGLQNLSNQSFYNVRSIVPPLQEQNEIVLFAERTTQKINDSIQYFHDSIKLLNEYRTRLIADVVTGKVDVRQAVTRLPEIEPEAELPEDLEEETELDESEEMLEEGDDAE